MLHYYELFDQLGLNSPAVIGHSFGGMLAAELASTNPERVSKLVLISSIGLWRDEQPVEDWMRLTPDKLIPLCFYEPEGKVATEIFKMPEDKIERQDEEIRRSWSLACSAAFIWPIPEKGLTRRIHRVKAPGFIVWGKQDGLVPPIYANDFKNLLPNSEVLIVDKAAHVPQLERQDLVSPAVIKFLNQ
jgi:pimeloyl-ACP methyl ester carboxylesterase